MDAPCRGLTNDGKFSLQSAYTLLYVADRNGGGTQEIFKEVCMALEWSTACSDFSMASGSPPSSYQYGAAGSGHDSICAVPALSTGQ